MSVLWKFFQQSEKHFITFYKTGKDHHNENLSNSLLLEWFCPIYVLENRFRQFWNFAIPRFWTKTMYTIFWSWARNQDTHINWDTQGIQWKRLYAERNTKIMLHAQQGLADPGLFSGSKKIWIRYPENLSGSTGFE